MTIGGFKQLTASTMSWKLRTRKKSQGPAPSVNRQALQVGNQPLLAPLILLRLDWSTRWAESTVFEPMITILEPSKKRTHRMVSTLALKVKINQVSFLSWKIGQQSPPTILELQTFEILGKD
jgi:hypothetical protein